MYIYALLFSLHRFRCCKPQNPIKMSRYITLEEFEISYPSAKMVEDDQRHACSNKNTHTNLMVTGSAMDVQRTGRPSNSSDQEVVKRSGNLHL